MSRKPNQQLTSKPPKGDNKIWYGNLIIDAKMVADKCPVAAVTIAALAYLVLRNLYVGRRTAKFVSIEAMKKDSIVVAGYPLRARPISFDEKTGRLKFEIWPSGLFGTMMLDKTKARAQFEAEFAYCQHVSHNGAEFIREIMKSNRFLQLRVDSFHRDVARGWFYYRRFGWFPHRINLNEKMIQKGHCEILAENLEEANEDKLRLLDQLKLSELYAKLTGKDMWLQYYKDSIPVTKLGSFYEFSVNFYPMKFKRWIRKLLV